MEDFDALCAEAAALKRKELALVEEAMRTSREFVMAYDRARFHPQAANMSKGEFFPLVGLKAEVKRK